jgi:cytochrome b involved in lipid metabolism
MSVFGSVISRIVVGTALPLAVAGAVLAAPAASAETTYTLNDVHKHATTADCWSAVNGGVYDLTGWINRHPGGAGVIKAMCGRNGSASYNGQHGSAGSGDDENEPAQALAHYRIGAYDASSAAAAGANKTYTMKQVRQHRTTARCWSVVNRNVYDLTAWVGLHPGGSAPIAGMCGRNGTAAFTAKHGGNASIAGTLADYKIGHLA